MERPLITRPRLLSVNVGVPREVEWQGKTVRTAIWKEPVDGPRMVRRLNIDGDDQADRVAHGGEHRAVFVYQIDSYRYWEQQLGRADFSYGQFGENFTVDGLADDEVCIGDRYEIGEAIFEVTTLRLPPDAGDGVAIVRSYSLSSVADHGEFRISVKLEPGGKGSTFIHEHIRPGDTVDVGAPRGTFVLRDSDHPVVLLSAGVGATPVLAMLHALAEADDAREVWWIHGARDSAEQAFGREVDALLQALPNAHRIVAYSRPGPQDQPGAGFDVTGRISIETIATAGISDAAEYYLCGPEAFMRELTAGLAAHAVAPERISVETFGAVPATAPGIVGTRPAPHQPAGPKGAGPAITFSRSDVTAAWDAGYESLLEFAEACDVPVGFGCRTGVCHSCETGLLAGDVEYVTTPLEDPERGRVLVCCAKPSSELTLDL